MIPSTFDRYLLREFLKYFLLALGGFVAFVLLFDAMDKIGTFLDHDAGANQVLRYYLYAAPFRAVLVTPVAILLATFLSLGTMTRFHEITIMKQAGVSLYRLFLPLYLVGLLVAAMSFVVSDFIMPDAEARAEEIYEGEIQGRSLQNLGSRLNVTYIGRGNRFYVIKRYDVPRSTMIDVIVQEFDDNTLRRRIDALQAQWDPGEEAWRFFRGVDRTFDAAGETGAAPFDTLLLRTPEQPRDFAKPAVKPEHMSFPELMDYINRIRQSGGQARSFITDLHLRVAFPLVNFMMVLIGASMAVQMRRGGVAIGFGLSLAIAFGYWALIRVGQVLGHAGTIPPLAGAWLGNVVFLALGGYLLYRSPK